MVFAILYTKTAGKDIEKLDAITKKRLKKKIEQFQSHPLQYATQLTHPKLGTYRWRIGNYRIIFDIDKNTIIVLRVRHRREVYQ